MILKYIQYCEEYKDSFVPVEHPIYGIISKVVMTLINGNLDVPLIRDQTWTIHIVDKNIKNAFVLPVSRISLQYVPNQQPHPNP